MKSIGSTPSAENTFQHGIKSNDFTKIEINEQYFLTALIRVPSLIRGS